MADAALMIGWNRVVAGREKMALELFNESLSFYGKLVSDKKLESFEPVLLGAHGGDMNGYVLLRGTDAQLDAVRHSREFENIMVRGLLYLDRLGVVDAYVGNGVQRILEQWGQAIPKSAPGRRAPAAPAAGCAAGGQRGNVACSADVDPGMARRAWLPAMLAGSLVACAAEPPSRVVAVSPPAAPRPRAADPAPAAAEPAPAASAPDPPPAPAEPPEHAEPPASLACLVRYYKASARHEDGAWFLVLPDGTKVPYAHHRIPIGNGYYWPNVTDLYAQRYPTGPIHPPPVDFEPGAMRLDPLLDATYGSSAREVRAALVRVHIAGTVFLVHRRVAEPLRRVAARIKAAIKKDPKLIRFFRSTGGSFNWRHIAGTHFRSSHSWGIALDLGTKRADYWRYQTTNPDGPFKWKNRYPQAIVDAFEAEGFIWGGRWYHFDTMHFEYRPELLDPACYPK